MNTEEKPKHTELDKKVLGIINNNPAVMSILYDVNLLPEQLKRHSKEWTYMIAVAIAFEAGRTQT